MPVVIRLKRAGSKGRPFYRVVVTDSRNPRDGRFIEQLGFYDPLTTPSTFKVDTEKFAHWVRHGAQPSESVAVMVAKIAPEALRPAPLARTAVAASTAAPAAKKAVKKKAAVKKKTVAKKKSATKGSEKKAKARARTKANKGVPAKPKAPKKSKK